MKYFFDRHGCGFPGSRHGFGRHGFGMGPDFFGARFGGFGGDPWEGRGRGGGGRMGDFGGGMGRGPGGRGGRMFAHGDLRLVVLELVAQSPRHGYDIIKAIEELFGGQYAPSPGAIYPTLTLLEEQEFLSSSVGEGGSKKLYTITQAGIEHLAQNRATVDGVMARMKMAAQAMAGDAPPEAIIQAMRTLKHALLYRRGAWSAEEAQRVLRIIQDAADAIAQGPKAV